MSYGSISLPKDSAIEALNILAGQHNDGGVYSSNALVPWRQWHLAEEGNWRTIDYISTLCPQEIMHGSIQFADEDTLELRLIGREKFQGEFAKATIMVCRNKSAEILYSDGLGIQHEHKMSTSNLDKEGRNILQQLYRRLNYIYKKATGREMEDNSKEVDFHG